MAAENDTGGGLGGGADVGKALLAMDGKPKWAKAGRNIGICQTV